MAVVYSNNFDANTTGVLPPGWANAIGSSGKVIASASAPSSPNALNVATAGNIAIYTAYGTLAGMGIRSDNVSIGGSFPCPALLCSAAGDYCYVVYPTDPTNLNAEWAIDRTYATVNNPAITTFTPSGLTSPISMRVQILDFVISIKLWNYGSSEPSGWTYQYSDPQVPTMPAGYPGFYVSNSGVGLADNFSLDDLNAPATDFAISPGSLSAFPDQPTGPYTVSLNGTPTSTLTVALSDGGAGGSFSPSSLTFTHDIPQTFVYTPAAGTGGFIATLTGSGSGPFTASHTTLCDVSTVGTGINVSPSSLATSAGVPTGNFSVVINGPLPATEYIAFSDGGVGGTFSPSALIFVTSNANIPQDFIYTPPNDSSGSIIALAIRGSGAFSQTVTVKAVTVAAQLFPPLAPQSLQNTVPSYLYLEYNDDDDLQALVAAYNQMAQGYITLFNQLGLPIYTGVLIAGNLLDWVGTGLYGYSRPALPNGTSQNLGPVNTFAGNALPANVSKNIAPSSLYVTTDDIYKRCLTWNLLKGDGKTFNIRWLKRRIMRFLTGINGTNPNIDQTYRISVTFGTGNQVNINILNGAVSVLGGTFANAVAANTAACNVSLSSFTPYQPIALAAILKSAIDSGALQLPFQFQYVVSV